MASRGSCLLVTNMIPYIYLIADGLAFTARDVYAYGVLIYEVYVEDKAMWERERTSERRQENLSCVPCAVCCVFMRVADAYVLTHEVFLPLLSPGTPTKGISRN